MLFSHTDELKKYIPANAEFEMDALRPFLENQGEQVLIKKYLGAALYTSLNQAYQSNTLTDIQRDLLNHVRLPLANYAILKYIPFGQVNISKGGIGISVSDTRKAAFEHQIESIRKACFENIYTGVELLLTFLEENKASFPTWVSGSGYTVFNDLLIRTATEFDSLYNIGESRRTFHALKSAMQEAEQMRLSTVTGPEFLALLKTEQAAGSLTAANQKAFNLAVRVVAYYAISVACLRLPVQITAEGINLLLSSDRQTLNASQPAEESRLQKIADDAASKAENYLKELSDLLYKNKTDYPVWVASSAYTQYEQSQSDNSIDQSGNGIVLF
jgi:hypothetical protein